MNAHSEFPPPVLTDDVMPLLERNLAALPEELLEPALFGSGANTSTPTPLVGPGVLESAARGTVVLSGVHELPLPTQALLVRALHERKVTRVGETIPRAIDVRIITVSYTDLQTERARGRFRDDLYARLAEVTLSVPSLPERPHEIRILAQLFLKEGCAMTGRADGLTFSRAALDHLLGRAWMGGIRELRAAVTSAVVGCKGNQLLVEDVVEEWTANA